jgi:hypothetical protein
LTLAERSTLPVFPDVAHVQGSDSLDDPLLGFDPPTRYVSKSLPVPSRPRAPLLGFIAPATLWEKGVHVPPVARRTTRCCRAFCQRVPPRWLRCRSQVFPTSQRPSSSPRRPAVFRQVAFLGFCPSGDCSARAAPTARHRRHALMTLLPFGWPPPLLGGGTLGRADSET